MSDNDITRELYREKMAEIAQLAMILGLLVNTDTPENELPPQVDALVMVGLSALTGMIHEVGFLPASILKQTEEGRKVVEAATEAMKNNKSDPRKAFQAVIELLSPPDMDVRDMMDEIPTVTDGDLEKLLASLSADPNGKVETPTPTDK